MSHLIDDILVGEEIHLCGGISTAGKTTWLLGTLYYDWQAGLPVLGHASHSTSWVYVSSDRSLAGVNRKLSRLGIPLGAIPLIRAWDQHMDIFAVIEAIRNSGAKLAIIESFGGFVEPPGNFYQVRRYMQVIHSELCHRGITVIGIMESPKMKPAERYEIARQRISGVAAWGHYSETVFMIEYADKQSAKTGTRILTVSDHDGPERVYHGDYSTGRLIFQ